MKVAFDARTIKSKKKTGIGLSSYKLIAHLVDITPSLDIHLFYPWLFDKFHTLLKEQSVKRRPLLMYEGFNERRFYHLWYDKILSSRLQKENFDIFHSPSWVLPSKKIGKFLMTLNDFSFSKTLRDKGYVPFVSETTIERLRSSIVNADKIIAVSQSIKDEFLRSFNVPEEKVEVIYWGIDERFVTLPPDEVARFRKEWDIPEQCILSVGVFNRPKNPFNILKAYKLLKTKYHFTEYHLLLIGKDYMNKRVHAAIQEMKLADCIRIFEYVNNEALVYFYNAVNLFLFPSLSEGFGLPVLEATQCGCPVVCSSIPALAEILNDAAHFVNPESAEDIAQGMYEVLSNHILRGELINKGSRRAQHFSWKNTAREVLKVYKTLSPNIS